MEKFEEYFRTTERYQDFLCWGSDKWIFKSVDGRYLSEEIQRLYEVWQHQQAKVEELEKQAEIDSQLIQLLKKANKDLVIERDELINKYNEYDKLLFQRNKDEQKLYDINVKHAAEKAELQKQVDAVIDLVQKYKDEDRELKLIDEWEQSQIYGLVAIELEQALKGEGCQ